MTTKPGLAHFLAGRVGLTQSCAPSLRRSPNWTPTATLASPSILAHLAEPSLLPSGASPTQSFITCYAPATGAHLATIPSHSAFQIAAKIAAAEAAQRAWRATSWAERRQVMRTLLSWLLRDVEAITRTCCRDTGKTSKQRLGRGRACGGLEG